MDTSGSSPMEAQSEAFSDALLQVKDMDEDDADNPMLCSDYVKDIYCYLRDLEVRTSAVANGQHIYMQFFWNCNLSCWKRIPDFNRFQRNVCSDLLQLQ